MKTKYRVEIFKDGKWCRCFGYSISYTEFNKKGWTRNLSLALQLKNSLSKQYSHAKYRIIAKYVVLDKLYV